MNTAQQAVESAIKVMGSQQALARSLGITQPTVAEWKSGLRPVPLNRCPDIESNTARAGEVVRVEELRPDVKWHRVKDKSWPIAEGRPLADFAGASV